MCGNVWPYRFETSLEDANVFLARIGADVYHFSPLSLCFENRISPILWLPLWFSERHSLIKISNKVTIVVYCLLKKININWALWVHEYMV